MTTTSSTPDVTELILIGRIQKMAVFIQADALSVWMNLGKHLLLDGLCVSSTCIKTGTRRIMRLDELSSVVRLERRTMGDSSSRRIMRPPYKNGQCQSIKNSGRHGFRRRIWSGPRTVLKLGLVAGYEETDIRVWKNTLRCIIKIISKTQTELSDLI